MFDYWGFGPGFVVALTMSDKDLQMCVLKEGSDSEGAIEDETKME